MASGSLGRVAYVLALIGGVILIIMGLLSFLGMAFSLVTFSMFGSFGGSFWGIIEIVLGIVAIYGSKRATDLVWAIVLIVVGIIAGGLGGILVLLGGILGLIARFV
jgi:hypothetical protein